MISTYSSGTVSTTLAPTAAASVATSTTPAATVDRRGSRAPLMGEELFNNNNNNNNNTRPSLSSSTSPVDFPRAPVLRIACRRFLLLATLLSLQSGSQFMLQRYEGLIRRHIVILLFLSMVVGAGGNAGNQAAVSVITALLATTNTQVMESNLPSNDHSHRHIHHSMNANMNTNTTHRASVHSAPSSPVVSERERSRFRRVIGWRWRAGWWNWPMRACRALLSVQRSIWSCVWRNRRPLGFLSTSTTRGARPPIAVSLVSVLRYECVVGLCCAAVLMCVGGLRVALFLLLDDNVSSATNASAFTNGTRQGMRRAMDTEDLNGRRVKMGATALGGLREQQEDMAVIAALSLSLFLIVFLAVGIGATLPYVLGKCNVNIEHAAPIVQVVMDLVGTWICCVMCNALLCPDEEG